MKSSLIRCLSVVFVVMVFSLASCGKDLSNTNSEISGNSSEQGKNNNYGASSSKMNVNICNNYVSLPCSLSELIGENVKLDDSDKNRIIESTNQTFTMIPAVCGDEEGVVYLKIKTGSNSEKKEANATVLAITNNDSANSDVFRIKDDHSIGSKVADVLASYGDGYVVDSAPSADDLSKGFVMLHYGDDEGILLWFRDGELIYIELFVGGK